MTKQTTAAKWLDKLSAYGVEAKIDDDGRLIGRIKDRAKYIYDPAAICFQDHKDPWPKQEKQQVGDGKWLVIGQVVGDGKGAFWHKWGYDAKESRWVWNIKIPRGFTVLWARHEAAIPTAASEGDGWGRLTGTKRLATQIVRTALTEWREEWSAHQACEQNNGR